MDLHIAALIFMSGTQALVSGSEEGDVGTTNALTLVEEDLEEPIPTPRPRNTSFPLFRPIGPTV